MIAEEDIDNVLETVKAIMTSGKKCPVSTYRLQFNSKFTFRDATRLVPYLHELGITDIYASPYFKARPGSQHGYDIIDHNSLNSEIGTLEDYREFVNELHRHGMGQILDFVPNHMSVFDNPWWSDVLENGRGSPYSGFFDIDWYPPKLELREKILLPILEDHYGKVLEAGGIRLSFNNGNFVIDYGETRLPVDPKTITAVLVQCEELMKHNLASNSADFLELQSIITACRNLPERSETDQKRTSERQREKVVIRNRLTQLFEKNSEFRKCISRAMVAFNGVNGESQTFNKLHELLESQAYRLSYWRTASDEINYRRFMDINNLVALRVEESEVFDAIHQFLFKLLVEGSIDGVRVDHIDGLFDPGEYLTHLQEAHILELSWRIAKGTLDLSDEQFLDWSRALVLRLAEEQKSGSIFSRPWYVVVEKILGEKETPPSSWLIYGTTGYEFASKLNGLFLSRRNERALQKIYEWFTGNVENFKDIAYQSKNLIMKTSMAAELAVLGHQLERVSEQSRSSRDFTLNSLRDGVREVIACFPVYRTYIQAVENIITRKDVDIVNNAISEAKKRNPAVSSLLFDFIRDMLLLKYPEDLTREGRIDLQRFVMRFQQLTAPVMAKGIEDTAFYIYNPLLSINDIGSNPERFGTSIDEFHRQNIQRWKTFPHSLTCTSTHDSKRSEDVRARLNILSEIPNEWKAALGRWRRANRSKKSVINGTLVPDSNEEFLIYQTLLGTYLIGQVDGIPGNGYIKRIQEYTLKAIREAKVHTSWISPDVDYEKAVLDFILAIFETTSNSFLTDFVQLSQVVTRCGMYNSLAQVVLKVFSPGVPDIYQGNELWKFDLVDPDNRRQVDYELRIQRLQGIKEHMRKQDGARLSTLPENWWQNGNVKMLVTSTALNYRRDHRELFNEGAYIPLSAVGSLAGHVCAFAWMKGSDGAIVVAPRLVARLTGLAKVEPYGPDVWGDTRLILPRRCGNKFNNLFTGEILSYASGDHRPAISLSDVFRIFPVAILDII
jgi:(1->4)-alpha-D-glucan 1-alpha-D-glucosylmutase